MQGWLRPKAAAVYCNVGERTLRTWLGEGELRFSKIKGTVLIKVSWLDSFLQNHEVKKDQDQVTSLVEEITKDLG